MTEATAFTAWLAGWAFLASASGEIQDVDDVGLLPWSLFPATLATLIGTSMDHGMFTSPSCHAETCLQLRCNQTFW